MTKTRKLHVNPEYKQLVPRASSAEYKTLETDMIEKGEATETIIINKQDVILDGHTRYEICLKHGLSFRTEEREFDSELDEKIFVVNVNLKRRHLTDMQKIILAKPLEALIAQKAKQRMLSTLKQGEQAPLASIEASGKTSEIVAKQIGVSKSTYERGKKIRETKSRNANI